RIVHRDKSLSAIETADMDGSEAGILLNLDSGASQRHRLDDKASRRRKRIAVLDGDVRAVPPVEEKCAAGGVAQHNLERSRVRHDPILADGNGNELHLLERLEDQGPGNR